MTDTTLIEAKLITIVAKSLQIPEKKVTLDARFFIELEAESIDILDIRFAIEQEFGFKFDSNEVKGLLKRIATEHNVTEKDIPALFTVRSIFDYVIYKLEQKNAA